MFPVVAMSCTIVVCGCLELCKCCLGLQQIIGKKSVVTMSGENGVSSCYSSGTCELSQ